MRPHPRPVRRLGPPLHEPDFRAALREKLGEETTEYLKAGDVRELVYALAALDGVTPAELEDLRVRKAEGRGGFLRRL